jgi:hypothetical protein
MTNWFSKLKVRLITYLSTEDGRYLTTEDGRLILIINKGQFFSKVKSVTVFTSKQKS